MRVQSRLAVLAVAASLAFGGIARAEKAGPRTLRESAPKEVQRAPIQKQRTQASAPVVAGPAGVSARRQGATARDLRRQQELVRDGDLDKARSAAHLADQARRAAGIQLPADHGFKVPSPGGHKPPSLADLRAQQGKVGGRKSAAQILGGDTPGPKPQKPLSPDQMVPMLGQAARNAGALRAALKARGVSDHQLQQLGLGGGGTPPPPGMHKPAVGAAFNPFPGLGPGLSPADFDPRNGDPFASSYTHPKTGITFTSYDLGDFLVVQKKKGGKLIGTDVYKPKGKAWVKIDKEAKKPKKAEKKVRKSKRKKKKAKKPPKKAKRKTAGKKKAKKPKNPKNEGRPWDDQGQGGGISEDALARYRAKQEGVVDPTGPDSGVEHDVERLAATIVAGEQSTVNPNPADDGQGGSGDGGGGGHDPGEDLVHRLGPKLPTPKGKGPRPIVDAPPLPGGGTGPRGLVSGGALTSAGGGLAETDGGTVAGQDGREGGSGTRTAPH